MTSLTISILAISIALIGQILFSYDIFVNARRQTAINKDKE